jgi:hypothetical protein
MPLCAVAHKAGWEFNTVLFLRIVVLAGRSVQSSRLSGFDLLRDEARKPIVHLHLTSERIGPPNSFAAHRYSDHRATICTLTLPQDGPKFYHRTIEGTLKTACDPCLRQQRTKMPDNEARCCRANSAPFCGLICGLKSRQSCC